MDLIEIILLDPVSWHGKTKGGAGRQGCGKTRGGMKTRGMKTKGMQEDKKGVGRIRGCSNPLRVI
ncbi:MAG: hypothetical protein ACJA02_001169 [Myxococcota bacterium]|jgi:hypothetical protein